MTSGTKPPPPPILTFFQRYGWEAAVAKGAKASIANRLRISCGQHIRGREFMVTRTVLGSCQPRTRTRIPRARTTDVAIRTVSKYLITQIVALEGGTLHRHAEFSHVPSLTPRFLGSKFIIPHNRGFLSYMLRSFLGPHLERQPLERPSYPPRNFAKCQIGRITGARWH